MEDVPQKTELSDECSAALRDVDYGFALIDRAPADDRVLLPLVATREAIDTALNACKSEKPEQKLRRQKRTIEGAIERVEEAMIPMPPLPTPPRPRRRPDNAALS